MEIFLQIVVILLIGSILSAYEVSKAATEESKRADIISLWEAIHPKTLAHCALVVTISFCTSIFAPRLVGEWVTEASLFGNDLRWLAYGVLGSLGYGALFKQIGFSYAGLNASPKDLASYLAEWAGLAVAKRKDKEMKKRAQEYAQLLKGYPESRLDSLIEEHLREGALPEANGHIASNNLDESERRAHKAFVFARGDMDEAEAVIKSDPQLSINSSSTHS